MSQNPPVLTARLIESFAGVFLSPLYDEAKPTPAFHRECWELYCRPIAQAAVIAPRGHAKSTALTHDYILATVLFRIEDYVVLVSSTEEMAMEHLSDIARELRDNEDLRQEFGVKAFVTDSKTDVIVKCDDGHEFRIIAKGSGQKMRGRKWKGKRPGLVVCDDLEDDEQVENRDSRLKFRRWFLRALKPVLRKGGKIRVHGTILHEDALLARIAKDASWHHLFYKAHKSFDDFSELLWPEQWPAERLREKQQEFIQQQDPQGYSQEYLNDPLDNSEAYLKRAWFDPMEPSDHKREKKVYAAADFAISKKDQANRTSLTVGGVCVANLLYFIDQRVGRWDTFEIIEEMFAIQDEHHPEIFFVEDGQIWKAISPVLFKEMLRRKKWINCVARTSITDKATRGRSLQKRMRAHATRWDTTADWFPGMQDEMLRFTGYAEATLDDQFDSAALLSLGIDDDLPDFEDEDFVEEEEMEMRAADPRAAGGRSTVTGY